jgi:methylated-DNA-[protein]-cysteine S-methyltransferase
MLLHYDEFPSPVGRILFASDGEAVTMLDFAGCEERMQTLLAKRFRKPEFKRGSDPLNMKRQLADYFDGHVHALDETPANTGGTPFQELVWKMLREIPVGHTWSYGQLAAKIGRPQAARAVGHANSLNPVAIIVPCHRVIGASSSLVGYGGGLERKEWLLRHEGARPVVRSSTQLTFAVP